MVLLIVALVSVVAASLVSHQRLMMGRVAGQLEAVEFEQHAHAGEELAKQMLRLDWEEAEQKGDAVDHSYEPWAQGPIDFPAEKGSVSLVIEDLAGRFNVNSLLRNGTVDAINVMRFDRLLIELDVKGRYAERLIDWMDADQDTRPDGAEDNQYLRLSVPYRTAGRELADLSELRLITEMSQEDYQAILPHLSSLPALAPININTADSSVLRAVSPGLTGSSIEHIDEVRRKGGYRSVSDFLADSALLNSGVEQHGLSVSSSYFQVTMDISLDGKSRRFVSVLSRNNKGAVSVMSRKQFVGRFPRSKGKH